MPPPRYPSSSGNNAALGGRDFVGLPSGATLIFSHPSVPKKLYVHSGANAIKWSYDLNTITTPTIGGEVTQILSCFVGPMTISGQTAGLRTDIEGSPRPNNPGYHSQDSYNANDELKNIMDWFLTYMHSAGANGKGSRLRDERAILFQYPERQWDFYIQVTSLDGFAYDKSVYAPEWSITAEVLNDNALNFFRGITMSSFTDQLTSKTLTSGFSKFAGGQADTNNKFFGQTGNSKNPFLNPTISASAADVAKRMGNNFQSLVAAWSTGDFANFGFNALLDNGAKPIDVDAAYQKLFGTTYLGNLGGYTGVGSGVGSSIYQVDQGVKVPNWVGDLLTAGKWPLTYENQAFVTGWGEKEGGGRCIPGKSSCNNWLNVTEPWPNDSIYNSTGVRNYATKEDGIAATIKLMHNGKYADIIGALKSGNPYTYGDLSDGLQTWVAGSTRNATTKEYADVVIGWNAKQIAAAGAGAPVSLPPGYQQAVDACKALILSGKLIIDKPNDRAALLSNGQIKRLRSPGAPPDPVPIDIKILHFLIWAGTKYPGTRASSIVGEHPQMSASGNQSRHWTGYGLDLGAVGGQNVASSSSRQAVLNFMTAVNAQNQTLKVRQMICNGVGNGGESSWDQNIRRLQIDNGQPATHVTADDHTNHIHIGY